MKIAIFALISLLGGCATCQEHRAACTAVAVVLTTSLALSAKNTPQNSVITNRPEFCQATQVNCK